MVFWNLNFTSITIVVVLLIVWLLIFWWLYKRSKKLLPNIFLALSYIFLIVNIFDIRWWFEKDSKDVKWWKVVFVMDVSKSMEAKDIIAKNNLKASRLDTTKELIKQYIWKYVNNKYGLMIFSWEAVEILPFTQDSSIFDTILYWLDHKNIFKSGTNLSWVFVSLTSYFKDYTEGGLVIILSDWWDEKIDYNNDQILDLKKKWVNIVLVWVWTKSWAKIPEWKDFFWKDIHKTYQWKEVITSLNDKEFQRVSKDLDIEYFSLNNISNFDKLIDKINKQVVLKDQKKSFNSRISYTREIILISLIFFILFFISDILLWQRKKSY